MASEGYVMVDHRASPGIPEDKAIKFGYHPDQVKEGALFEAAILKCRHCPRNIVKNPLRTRERAFCLQCNSYICDWCEAARRHPDYVHRTMEDIAELVLSGKLSQGN
jgi:hypothetical protein